LQEVRNRGILFAVATARPIRAVVGALPFLKFDVGIFHNGAIIMQKEQHLATYGVENPLEIISRILADKPDTHFAVEVEEELYANFDATQIWEGIPYIYTKDFKELENAVSEKVIIQAGSQEEMQCYEKYLTDDLYIQISENVIAMIMNRKASKWNGIQAIAREKGFTTGEVVAFGDDYNDAEMLRECGRGVAMANALAVVKEVADEVCLCNEEDGVAKWIEKNILLNT
jgi:Cof subfamily protein (haloacid dehalogenase superfamily)